MVWISPLPAWPTRLAGLSIASAWSGRCAGGCPTPGCWPGSARWARCSSGRCAPPAATTRVCRAAARINPDAALVRVPSARPASEPSGLRSRRLPMVAATDFGAVVAVATEVVSISGSWQASRSRSSTTARQPAAVCAWLLTRPARVARSPAVVRVDHLPMALGLRAEPPDRFARRRTRRLVILTRRRSSSLQRSRFSGVAVPETPDVSLRQASGTASWPVVSAVLMRSSISRVSSALNLAITVSQKTGTSPAACSAAGSRAASRVRAHRAWMAVLQRRWSGREPGRRWQCVGAQRAGADACDAAAAAAAEAAAAAAPVCTTTPGDSDNSLASVSLVM